MEVCNSCGRQYVSEEDYIKKTSKWRFCESGHLWFNCSCNAILKIEQGKFDWFSPEKVMDANIASLFNKLSKKSALPYIPSSIMRIQMLLSDENSTSEKFVAEVKQDPTLAAEILNHANNIKFGTGQKIDSLAFAFSYIGRPAIAQITLLASIKSFKFKTKKFVAKDFWHFSTLTGVIAEQLNKKLDLKLSDDVAYVSGSMCNIGKVVMAIVYPDITDQIMQEINAASGSMTWVQAESKIETFSHVVLGELAAAIWGLPEYVKEANACHHIDPAKNDKVPLVGTLAALANQIAHIALDAQNRIDEDLLSSLYEKYNLNDTVVDELIAQVKKDMKL